MIIYNSRGIAIIGLDVDDTSYRYREIMGDNTVYLEFSLTQHVEFEIGSYIEFQGERYTLMSLANVTITHNREFDYKVTFQGAQSRFAKYRIHNPVDGRLVFEMIAYPAEHLAVIIANLNEREGSNIWSVGACIEGPQKAMSYNHTRLDDALTTLATLYDTEWEISSHHVISLHKVEYNANNPLALAYGKGNGFKSGVGRTNYGENGQIERLYIQGGSRNISLSEYGNTTLLLPKSFAFSFDGSKFRYTHNGSTITETGYDASKAVAMTTDANGYSVMLSSAPAACNEESLDLTDIYPKRVGKVTDVRYIYNNQYLTWAQINALSLPDDEWLKVQVDIVDSTIPASLDFDACLLENGDPMLVTFQTGMLAGREFSVQKFHKEAQNATIDGQTVEQRPANRFELVRATFNDIDMPNATFRPNAGSTQDDYIVTNIYLPDAYICDYATTSGAEFEALRAAAKFLYDNKDVQVTFKGEIDDLYVKRNWLNVGGRLILGGCVSFSHPQVQAQPLVTRIIAIKDYINDPYSPEITLSNESVKGGLSSRLAQIAGETARAQTQTAQLERYTKRSFRDAKETMEMLVESLLDGYTEQISPIAVQTMQALVGDESLQFRYVTSKVNPVVRDSGITYNASTKKLSCTANIIEHMTLGVDSISNAHSSSEHMFWDISAFESPYLGDDLSAIAYYLYAKCSKAEEGQTGYQTAEYVLSDQPIAMEAESGYYHLLVGILNSEADNDRSFATLYGFTEILPGRVTTDKIVSSTGETYIDLLQNIINFGNKLTYNNGNLVLNGSLVVSGSGEQVALGAYCGEYNSSRIYKLGDEVIWQSSDGTISTYRYINTEAGSNHTPSDDNYWEPVAVGTAGESPVYADLDNEFDSVNVNSNGVTTASATRTTNATMWYGTTQIPITSINITGRPTGVTASTADVTGGGKLITFTIASGSTITSHDIKITVGDGTYSRDLHFTLGGIRAGAKGADGSDGEDGSDGADAIRYYLVPSVTSVKKDKAGNYSVAKVSCKRYRQVGTAAAEEVFSVGTLKYSLDGSSTETTASASTEVSTSSFTKTLTWLWYINSVVADRETIPMIIDGVDGQNGQNGANGSDGRGIVSIQETGWINSPSGTVVPSTWLDTKPAPIAGQYLWTKTTITYTNNTSENFAQAVYCAMNGSNGEDGQDGSVGPAIVYRGEYNKDEQGNTVTQTYYATSKRCDVVYYASTQKWYMALYNGTDRSFDSKLPTNTTYWAEFGNNFDNVATGLLLADYACINNLGVKTVELKQGANTVGGMSPATSTTAGNANTQVLWIGTATKDVNAPFYVTYDGKMKASSGTIAGLTIGTNSLKYGSSFTIWADESGSSGTKDKIAIVTNNRQNIFSSTSTSYTPISITQSAASGIVAALSGGFVDWASGLRLFAKKVTASYTIAESDIFIWAEMSNTGQIIYPPYYSNIDDWAGKVFIIYNAGSNALTVRRTTTSQFNIYRSGNVTQNAQYSLTANKAIVLIAVKVGTWLCLEI